jgi:hypothetical protein
MAMAVLNVEQHFAIAIAAAFSEIVEGRLDIDAAAHGTQNLLPQRAIAAAHQIAVADDNCKAMTTTI